MYNSKRPILILTLVAAASLILHSTLATATVDDADDIDIDELIALDEEQDQQTTTTQTNNKPSDGTHHHTKQTDILSKAQRIVLELNGDNTKKTIDENEFVFVLGYAPWCGISAELMPRFAEAAMSLRELGSVVLMAKIDADRYPKVGESLGIKGFPSLLLFVNGSPMSYSGGFSSEDIVTWVRKKTGMPVIRIQSVNEAEDFLKKHSSFAIGLFEKFEGLQYEEFIKAASSDNEFQFVETSSAEITNVLFPDGKPTTQFFGLVKSEIERYTIFEDTLESNKILQFLDDNKFPLVTTLTELNSAKVYSVTNKLQVFLFAETDDLKKLLKPFQDVARKFKSKIMVVFVDKEDENLAKPHLSLFGLEESEDTVVAAFDYKNNFKYLLKSDPTPTKIEEFCSGILDSTLSPFYKSQPIPDNKAAEVLTVVGKTFDDLVLNNPKNVLLEVHAPWCFKCETTSKNVEKLAKHFKGLETLTFARIDASANEHPKLQVDDYPMLLFYPADDKTNPIKLSTKSSLKDLAITINKNLKSQNQVTKDEL